jgi:small subunit ribosomal protein S27Ae
LFNGKLLEDGNVGDYQINAEAAIYMLVAMEGGKGKKKKKKTKKPKKPHKKKKVKLAILNYFKVDGDKVVRLRQRSPAGTFMAEHQDRYYCGRSHITYKKKEEKQAVKAEKPADKGAAKADAKEAPAKGKGKK